MFVKFKKLQFGGNEKMTFKVSGYYVLQLKQLYPLRGGGGGVGGWWDWNCQESEERKGGFF